MVVLLQDLFECLQVWTNTQTGLEIFDILSPEGRGGDGVIVGKYRAAQLVHLVLEGPVCRQTEGVDQTAGRQDGVQTDELVPVHLLVLTWPSNMPVTSHPLQSSKQVNR